MKEEIELTLPEVSGKLTVRKPQLEDIPTITAILGQWVDEAEAITYAGRIQAEYEGSTEYGMVFYSLRLDGTVIGVGGLSDPLPAIMQYALTTNPSELKILYLDSNRRGCGYGGAFLRFLESEAKQQGGTEILLRSAEKFRDTAFEFYKRSGYEDLGQIMNADNKPMQLFRKVFTDRM